MPQALNSGSWVSTTPTAPWMGYRDAHGDTGSGNSASSSPMAAVVAARTTVSSPGKATDVESWSLHHVLLLVAVWGAAAVIGYPVSYPARATKVHTKLCTTEHASLKTMAYHLAGSNWESEGAFDLRM